MKKIFVSALVFDDGKSGISTYIENTIYALANNHKIYVAILKKDIKNFNKKHKNIHFITFPNFLKSTILNILFHLFLLPFYTLKNYDFIFLPAANRRVMAFYPRYTIATFHDLSQCYIPQKYDKYRMFYVLKILPLFLKPIKKILAVSSNTKQDLIKYFNINPKKIVVNYNGIDIDLIKNLHHNSSFLEKKYDIKKEYFIYVSRIEHPGKNHINLIKAYEALPLEIKNNYDLIFIGKACENSDYIFNYINNSQDKKRIKVLGFINQKDLTLIFSKAKLFVMPSFYEGFGIPLIEAMYLKVPAISASNSSLLEIGKDICIFFDEYKISSITNTIIKVIKNKYLQKRMIKNGLLNIKKYTWRNHANKIIQLHRSR